MKKGKISIATMIGLYATGKKIYDDYKAGEPYDIGMDWVIRDMTGICTPKMQAAMADPKVFNYVDPLTTWAPTVGGALISKYVGGPKGLNINSKISALPLFKL